MLVGQAPQESVEALTRPARVRMHKGKAADFVSRLGREAVVYKAYDLSSTFAESQAGSGFFWDC